MITSQTQSTQGLAPSMMSRTQLIMSKERIQSVAAAVMSPIHCVQSEMNQF